MHFNNQKPTELIPQNNCLTLVTPTIRNKSPKTIGLFFSNYPTPFYSALLHHRKNLVALYTKEGVLEKARTTSRETEKKSTANKLRDRQTKILEEIRFTRLLWNLLRHKRLWRKKRCVFSRSKCKEKKRSFFSINSRANKIIRQNEAINYSNYTYMKTIFTRQIS